MKVTAAAIQLTSTQDWEDNLRKADGFVNEAADRGARIVALPENFAYLHGEGEEVPCAQSLNEEFIERMKALARLRHIYLLSGTIPEKIKATKKIYNTSVFLNPQGKVIGIYRKIHLFDVNIKGRAVFEESKIVEPGQEVVLAETEYGKFGMTICYDLRFPELYRRLTLSGAKVILVPSAFTEYTGKEHWETLLRARAIENQVYIIAPAQFGQHNPKRRTYGKSMIVDPWGTILCKAADKEALIMADLDFEFQDKIRTELPCLEHTRLAS